MRGLRLKRWQQLGLALLGTYAIAGCPNQANSRSLVDGALTPEVVAQEVARPDSASESISVSFNVCAEVENWQRPSDAEQAKQLGADARYGAAAQGDQLKAASTQFWNHEAVSFTTYGLSARMEPVNLSGLWTVADDLWGCYEPEATVAINEGDRAETWLLNQRITDLQWQGDRYLMTVEPAATGVQVVQFERLEDADSLPLEIVTDAGQSVAVVSGDWQ